MNNHYRGRAVRESRVSVQLDSLDNILSYTENKDAKLLWSKIKYFGSEQGREEVKKAYRARNETPIISREKYNTAIRELVLHKMYGLGWKEIGSEHEKPGTLRARSHKAREVAKMMLKSGQYSPPCIDK